MSDHSSRRQKGPRPLSVIGVLALTLAAAAPAAAQSAPAGTNSGAVHFTGGLDVPSVYVFRGLVQETDPKLTLWPYGDLGIALHAGDGVFKTIGVNLGVWNSLHTGSSGSDGISAHAHYEEDFYSTLSLGFGGGIGVSIGYMALTSPNFTFDTVKELQLKITKAHRLNPYGFVAAELTDVSSDGGVKKGTYLELGVGPSFALGPRASLTIPAKVGLSAKDYYELDGEDKKFGFFDVGALVTIPLKAVPARFGSWNVHGGVDVFAFGDRTKVTNNDRKASKAVALVGIGVAY